jgi:hypothetical protein
MLFSVALDALWRRRFRDVVVADKLVSEGGMDRFRRPRCGHVRDLQRETQRKNECKKRHARVKKAIFRLETAFFSSSIRSASRNADSHW